MLTQMIMNLTGKMGNPGENITNAENPDEIFKLPIEYVNKSEVHDLSPVVANDLELVTSNTENGKSMYDYLFNPKHEFAKQMIPKWGEKYTSNPSFIEDSQIVIQHSNQYIEKMKANTFQVDCDRVLTIWKNVKEDPRFLEKYSYMEWEMFKYLNNSSSYFTYTDDYSSDYLGAIFHPPSI